MQTEESVQRDVLASLLEVWSSENALAVLDLISDGYIGHMLHLEAGERTKTTYPSQISSFRTQNPGTIFTVIEQRRLVDGFLTRLMASRADGAYSYGMNQSRFVGPLIAEEWAIWSDWHSV
jgi:hypothetical protein